MICPHCAKEIVSPTVHKLCVGCPDTVRVDLGYQTNEHWVEARVIQRIKETPLFGGDPTNKLYVALPSGERVWVNSWEEIK